MKINNSFWFANGEATGFVLVDVGTEKDDITNEDIDERIKHWISIKLVVQDKLDCTYIYKETW